MSHFVPTLPWTLSSLCEFHFEMRFEMYSWSRTAPDRYEQSRMWLTFCESDFCRWSPFQVDKSFCLELEEMSHVWYSTVSNSMIFSISDNYLWLMSAATAALFPNIESLMMENLELSHGNYCERCSGVTRFDAGCHLSIIKNLEEIFWHCLTSVGLIHDTQSWHFKTLQTRASLSKSREVFILPIKRRQIQ